MSVNAKVSRTPAPLTSREILEEAAGEEHALHTVVRKNLPARGRLGRIEFWCSCGAMVFVPDTERNRLSLQNVRED